jgi:hypothetical protein
MKRRDFFTKALAGAALTTAGASLRSNLVGAALQPTEVLRLAGTHAASPTCYDRMFRGLPQGAYSRESLEELAKKMKGVPDPHRRSGRDSSGKQLERPPAGYTYLGQFIDHDLTLDLTPLEGAQPDETKTQNFRTPLLDLDHVYGGGPNLSPYLYKKHGTDSPEGAERFLIGTTEKKGDRKPLEDDLPRNSQGIALTADPRQDENVILAQLHVAFLKLHNLVIRDSKLLETYRNSGSDFVAAQRLVKWHYQWVVRKDFLETIVDLKTVDLVRIEKAKRQSPPVDFKIPIEFSAAAFRFGHSMVRDEYDYNQANPNAQLKELLDHTRAPLPAEWIISWNHFFLLPNAAHLNSAQGIDTKIAAGLYGLDVAKTIRPFSAPMPEMSSQPAGEHHGVQIEKEHRLPVRTLWRGAKMGLPSGQEVAKRLAIKPLTSAQLAKGLDAAILKKHPFHEDAPLWYYILREAELSDHKGARLGPVGSHIVADVIIGALAADPDSYLSAPLEWKPTLPAKASADKFEISDILSFIERAERDNT